MNGNGKKTSKLIRILVDNRVSVLLALLWAISGIVTGGIFFRASNLSSLFKQVAVMGILSEGLCVIMAAGSIDLAIGNILMVSGLVYGMTSVSLPWGVSLIVTVLTGMLLGWINGAVPHRLHLPPFITTMAVGNVFTGIGLLMVNGKNILNLPPVVKVLGQKSVIGIPVPMIIMLLVMAAIAFMMNCTKVGRQLLATGGNRKAAEVSGLNTTRLLIFSHMIEGACAAIGAIVLTGRVGAAMTSAGDSMTLDVIAAVIIGGTSMEGGRVKPMGAIIGCVLIGTISNMLNLAEVSPYWQYIATGSIIVIAVFLNVYSERYLARKARES
jgi:ribose/xylose/arabinose/galactoside ABC-type transport system permease subunit